jgi:hypothetical protein
MAAVLDQIDPRAAACWWARRERIAFMQGGRGGCALGQGLRGGDVTSRIFQECYTVEKCEFQKKFVAML